MLSLQSTRGRRLGTSAKVTSMRWSESFIPTLRDAPADAEAASHKLLVRGGFIRQLHAGHYSLLPLGLRVHAKVERIVRECIEEIGGQEFLLPAMHPAWLWQQTGRWETMGAEMFRLRDRKQTDIGLAMTHEEAFTDLLREITSYRSLPQIWYQIQWKFRDEPRPKSGLLRVREFAMKDSYSFDIDDAGLDRSFNAHHRAYTKIFQRLSLDTIAVEASSGAMGGTGSVEFMVPSDVGEDNIVRCGECGYAANVQRATAAVVTPEDGADNNTDAVEAASAASSGTRTNTGGSEDGRGASSGPVRFPTPGVRTIADLETVEGGAPAHRQIKTMAMVLDGTFTLALLRGDHKLNLQKLADTTGSAEIRSATPEETLQHLGARPGSLGPVGATGLPIVADPALRDQRGLLTGANEDDWHYSDVDMASDVAVDRWADLREVGAGEPCTHCGSPLELVHCIETGHIFKLGRRYAEAFGAFVLDNKGNACTITMGSYGIGIGRTVAAIAEVHHDDRGLKWPVAVAPYQAAITVANMASIPAVSAAERLYRELQDHGVEVLLDDRNIRAGAKFADAELIGIPWRITVGRDIAEGRAELYERFTDTVAKVPLAEMSVLMTSRIAAHT